MTTHSGLSTSNINSDIETALGMYRRSIAWCSRDRNPWRSAPVRTSAYSCGYIRKDDVRATQSNAKRLSVARGRWDIYAHSARAGSLEYQKTFTALTPQLPTYGRQAIRINCFYNTPRSTCLLGAQLNMLASSLMGT